MLKTRLRLPGASKVMFRFCGLNEWHREFGSANRRCRVATSNVRTWPNQDIRYGYNRVLPVKASSVASTVEVQ